MRRLTTQRLPSPGRVELLVERTIKEAAQVNGIVIRPLTEHTARISLSDLPWIDISSDKSSASRLWLLRNRRFGRIVV